MKKYLFLALGVAALTSCSSDEVTELNQGNEIKFSVVADNDSRAHDIWCNANKPQDFRVWANSGGNAFMADDEYTFTGDAYTSTTVRYWPETAGVDFYALKYTGDVTYESGNQPKIEAYNPATLVSEQQDIIYATKPGATKTADGVVALNFRHALSQIEFMAKNNNPTIKVLVKNVCVGNAVTNGTFTLPAGTTENPYVDATHGTTGTGAVPATFNQGTWDLTAKTYTDYSVAVQNPSAALTTTASSLTLSTGANITSATDHGVVTDDQSMMLIPCSGDATTAWDPTEGNLDAGSYLGIDVVISNIVTVDGDTYETEIYSGWAYVPAVFAWEQGKRYVYTFNFGAGKDGGFRADGTPVLTDINLNITVDDFIWAGDTQKEMDTEVY